MKNILTNIIAALFFVFYIVTFPFIWVFVMFCDILMDGFLKCVDWMEKLKKGK